MVAFTRIASSEGAISPLSFLICCFCFCISLHNKPRYHLNALQWFQLFAWVSLAPRGELVFLNAQLLCHVIVLWMWHWHMLVLPVTCLLKMLSFRVDFWVSLAICFFGPVDTIFEIWQITWQALPSATYMSNLSLKWRHKWSRNLYCW